MKLSLVRTPGHDWHSFRGASWSEKRASKWSSQIFVFLTSCIKMRAAFVAPLLHAVACTVMDPGAMYRKGSVAVDCNELCGATVFKFFWQRAPKFSISSRTL